MESQTIWQLIFQFGQVAVFFWIFAIGAVFAIIFFIFGELFDGLEDIFHGVFDALHLDALFNVDAHGGGGPSVFSPRVVGVFITIFGASGFLASIKEIGPISSSLIGVAGGFAVATLFYWVFSWIYSQQSTSVVNNAQLIGSMGAVCIQIPSGGIGQVVIGYAGSRLTKSAKSGDGRMIGVNKNVIVKEVRGHILIVDQQ